MKESLLVAGLVAVGLGATFVLVSSTTPQTPGQRAKVGDKVGVPFENLTFTGPGLPPASPPTFGFGVAVVRVLVTSATATTLTGTLTNGLPVSFPREKVVL